MLLHLETGVFLNQLLNVFRLSGDRDYWAGDAPISNAKEDVFLTHLLHLHDGVLTGDRLPSQRQW